MPTGHQCAYPPCQCYVEKKGDFCSAHCRQAQASGHIEDACRCGHPACRGRSEEDQDGAAG